MMTSQEFLERPAHFSHDSLASRCTGCSTVFVWVAAIYALMLQTRKSFPSTLCLNSVWKALFTQTFLWTPPGYLTAARSQRASSGQIVWHAARFQSPAPRQTAVGGTGPPGHLQAPNKDSPSSSQPEETAAWSGEKKKKEGVSLLVHSKL